MAIVYAAGPATFRPCRIPRNPRFSTAEGTYTKIGEPVRVEMYIVLRGRPK